MKKNDSLSVKKRMPKAKTVQFILNFSKSLATVKTPIKTFCICKN